ncbi:hypothetical protein RRG08_035432 [Elysia crispata]|uniref:Uncharacterized protein n=1 Tax=Elysia crispata TaxID=231223 RepID=A0AAE1CSK0_9GAST|nr:hypothetical protein RRG08_035432 [Elysia crispata]
MSSTEDILMNIAGHSHYAEDILINIAGHSHYAEDILINIAGHSHCAEDILINIAGHSHCAEDILINIAGHSHYAEDGSDLRAKWRLLQGRGRWVLEFGAGVGGGLKKEWLVERRKVWRRKKQQQRCENVVLMEGVGWLGGRVEEKKKSPAVVRLMGSQTALTGEAS